MSQKEEYGFSAAAEKSTGFLLLLIGVEAVDAMLGVGLDRFGILPWTIDGLIGIIFSPLLHGNFGHLIANAGPLFVLMIILFWNRRYLPERTLLLIWVLSGIGTWLIGREHSIHIGASSIVYGLFFYLIAAAFWMACWRAFFFSILVFLLFGGLFYGLFQIKEGVSWEGHLSGSIAGFWVAWLHHKR